MDADPSSGSDWSRVKELTADALELPPAERQAFLDGLCDETGAVREQVARLVAVSAAADDRLGAARDAALAGVAVEPEVPPPDASWAGREVGGYTIQRFVARGGMGAVFEATQTGTGKRVAIKVLARTSSEAWRARFRHEIGLLARLSHPAIAQIVDADLHEDPEHGTWPFFALEFVDGAPITRFADQERLDLKARLRMMVDVCRGVQHAHQRGVIHRDLKPENILVARPDGSGPPQPKVLDFGIGRLEDANDATSVGLTREGDVLGTLAYMSPEQVGGNPAAIDTRSDVYALGVLLYQLITGELPIDVRGLALTEAVLRIAQTEPRPASAVRLGLDDDVDTICATAMANDRERRYASASELAADLERYLANEPLAAQPASGLHHLRLFAKRHRGLVAGAIATAVVFVLGAAGTGAGFLNAQREATRANEEAVRANGEALRANEEATRASIAAELAVAEAERARRAGTFLGEVLGSADPEILGREGRMRDALLLHGPRIDRVFADDDRSRAEMHAVIGNAWHGLGEYADAETYLTTAWELFVALDGADSDTALRAEIDVVRARNENGEHSDEALQRIRALCDRAAEHLGPTDPDTLRARREISFLLYQAGQVQESLALQRQLYAETREALGVSDTLTLSAGSELGAHLTEAGELDEAAELLAEVHAASLRLHGPSHPRSLHILIKLATADSYADRNELALERFDRAREDARETWEDDHPLALLLRANRASALMGLALFEDALSEYREIRAMRREIFGEAHPQTLSAHYNVGVNLAYLGRPEESIQETRELLRLAERCNGCEEGFVMRASGLLAGVLMDLDRVEEAVPISELALEEHRRLLGPTHFQTLIQENNHARLLGRAGRAEEGIALFERMLASWTVEYPGIVAPERTFRWNFARLLEEAGYAQRAEEQFLLVNEQEEAAGPAPRPSRAEVLERLVAFYEAEERPEEAAAAKAELAALSEGEAVPAENAEH